MSIFVARIEDVPALVGLGEAMHRASSYAKYSFDGDKVARRMQTLIGGDGVVFCADRAGQVIGGIAGGVDEFWFGHDLHGFDFAFFIHPEHRQGTIALRLLMAFESWCKGRKAREVRLGITTGINLEGTGRFYEWCGYRNNGNLFTKELS